MARPRKQASLVDAYVGHRIRERRLMLGVTQSQLGEKIGVTYQQAHKYECGINRISAGRLYEIACELGMPIEYFYDGFDDIVPLERPANERLILEMARHFNEIQDEKHQEAISQLIRTLAGRS